MTPAWSLRARLTAVILGPLLLIALAIGLWAWTDAHTRAADRFDRSLQSTALAISRDTALSGGDALSPRTRDLLRDTSGGQVFYHVYAPDGVFVTGYATPPVPPGGIVDGDEAQTFYEAVYQGRAVRAVRMSDAMSIDGVTGPFTFTVWQHTSVRTGFVESLTRRTGIVITTLVAALALLVWFGVGLGLRPLRDLEDAIARRSAMDLSPIRRPIPREVKDVVGTLNRLLSGLAEEIRTKDDFIADAAHQLRNPVSGVLSLAQSVEGAMDATQMKRRAGELVSATKDLSRLTDSLLALERAKAASHATLTPLNVRLLLRDLAPSLEAICKADNVRFRFSTPNAPLFANVDKLLLDQAVTNLVHNAVTHGGPELGLVTLEACAAEGECIIEVQDDGVGLSELNVPVALARFGQITPSGGSGLGLPFVEASAKAMRGRLEISTEGPGLTARIIIPLATPETVEAKNGSPSAAVA